MKRFFDIIFSFICICLTLPIMILVAIAIKVTSRGPIFFLQERVGYLGKHFVIYKFRTMIPDSNKCRYLLRENDPRITWIGKYLRASHIDELPQFLNILKGDMAFVGPRPQSVRHHNVTLRKISTWNNRLETLPGLTNLASVKLGILGVRKRSHMILLYDTFYIQHKSIKFDFFVIYLTMVYFIQKLKPPLS